jgi:hypothetical protein
LNFGCKKKHFVASQNLINKFAHIKKSFYIGRRLSTVGLPGRNNLFRNLDTVYVSAGDVVANLLCFFACHQDCQIFSRHNIPKWEQIIQNDQKYITWPQNLPNDNKMHQHLPLPDPPKFTQIWELGLKTKNAIWQPCVSHFLLPD